MPCELWCGGYGQIYNDSALRYSNYVGTYYEFLVSIPSIAPTAPFTALPTRSNPGITNASYDQFNHAGTAASGTCGPGNWIWRINRPPKYFYKGSCPPSALPTQLDPAQRHDCINGNCLPSTVHNTIGWYSNFADCQAGCAKNSPCNGECVPVAELVALQAAANAVRERLC
jgi:hypothetical protein